MDRKEEIRQLLQDCGNLTVAELAEHFGVSEMTIRRDLKVLNGLGLIQREHGRALYVPQPTGELFWARLSEAEREKVTIGREAAKLVAEGDSIILDAGTTTLALAEALTQRCVVITNSLPIAVAMAGRKEATTLLTGGEVRGETNALVGPLAKAALTNFNASKLFLAATGVSVERGLSTANMHESEVKQAMLAAAQQVILLAHSQKIGQVYYHTFANWDQIDILVTDSNLPLEQRTKIEELGVKVLCAKV